MAKPIDKPPVRPLASIPRTKGVFNPELVGRIAGYPHSPVAYAAMVLNLKAHSDLAGAAGTKSRKNIPNGWTRETSDRARAEAELEGRRIMRAVYRNSMDPNERPDPALSPNSDRSRGEMAMTACLAMVLGPGGPVLRQRSWNTLVSYLKPPGERPETLEKGLDWLRGLARTGANASYQHPVPGLPVEPSDFEKAANAFLDSLIGKP